MPKPMRSTAPLAPWLILGLVAAAILPGMAAGDDRKDYVEEKYAFSFGVPEPWAVAPTAGYSVPGKALAAWSGPARSSIVAFVQEPGRAYTARFLVDLSAGKFKEGGVTVKAAEVREVDGKKAMWMVVTGKGTGGALDGKGGVDTAQQWVAIPLEKDILVMILTCPAPDYEARRPSFEKAVMAMKIQGKQTPEQAEAK